MKIYTFLIALSALATVSFAAAENKLSKCPDAKIWCDTGVCELGSKVEQILWTDKCMKSEMKEEQCHPDPKYKCSYYKVYCDTGVCQKGTHEEKKSWFDKCIKENLRDEKC